MPQDVKPDGRVLAGVFLIIALIIVWAILVATLARWVHPLPGFVHLIYYLAAGTLWVLPLGPLLRWMKNGRRR